MIYSWTPLDETLTCPRGKRAASQNVFHFACAMRKTVGLSHGFGAHGARETPVPIPNTAVKPRSGYNTWVLTLGK